MPEDMEIVDDNIQTNEYYDNQLLAVISHQIDTLYYLEKIDYEQLYDQAIEHKIACVENCFKVIAAAQKALLKEIQAA